MMRTLHAEEITVLRHAANGRTVRQTAHMLRVDEWRIKRARRAALDALGAETMSGAVATALRLGILTRDDVEPTGPVS